MNGNVGAVLPRWYPEPSRFATISSLVAVGHLVDRLHTHLRNNPPQLG
jgi:hypothetical protein